MPMKTQCDVRNFICSINPVITVLLTHMYNGQESDTNNIGREAYKGIELKNRGCT